MLSSVMLSSCQQHWTVKERILHIIEVPFTIATFPLLIVGFGTAAAAQAIKESFPKPNDFIAGQKRLVLIGKKFTIKEDMPIYQFVQNGTTYCSNLSLDESSSSNNKSDNNQHDTDSDPLPTHIGTLRKGTILQVVKITTENPENIDFPYKVFVNIDTPEWEDQILDATPLFKDKIQKALEEGYSITPIYISLEKE